MKYAFLMTKRAWSCSQKKIFWGGNSSIVCRPELEAMGRKILSKCHGLPLAIVVLGSLLSTMDETLIAWCRVLESVTWRLFEDTNVLMEVISLSYYHLPPWLKLCFLYCSLFPKDSPICSKKLIRLWIAEGFIQQGVYLVI